VRRPDAPEIPIAMARIIDAAREVVDAETDRARVLARWRGLDGADGDAHVEALRLSRVRCEVALACLHDAVRRADRSHDHRADRR